MIQNKIEVLRMKPDDTLLMPITNPVGSGIVDLHTNINYMTMTFPDRVGNFALLLSGKEEVELFRQIDLKSDEPFHFRPVRIRDLFAILMVNRTNILLDPFGDELVVLTPRDMYNYCRQHQDEIYKDQGFESVTYTEYRIRKAKENGSDEKKRLMKDLVENGVFFVASTPTGNLSPCVSQIGKVDRRKHLMLFTSEALAIRFCQHANLQLNGAGGNPLIPVRVTLDQLRAMKPEATGAEMCYLNDGSEGIAFSYQDFPIN